MNSKRALVAISGGVDSVAACLQLLDAGWEVEAFHLLIPGKGLTSQSAVETELQRIKKITSVLGIKLHFVDKTDVFHERVIAYFMQGYALGQTPNPCVICNPDFKIASGVAVAEALGIKFIATGHYARSFCDSRGCSLFMAKDKQKDQSYFLHRIPQAWFASLLFPLGEITKSEAKKNVARKGLADLIHKESQDICFFSGDYRQFLASHGMKFRPGQIVTTDGKVLGRHQGLIAYTIGQRHGLGLPDRTPFYVIRLDISKNQLIVGKKEELFKLNCRVKDVNWLESFETWPEKVNVKLRYRHPGVFCRVILSPDIGLSVTFETAQAAVTPGQFAVFYHEDKALGGGVICA